MSESTGKLNKTFDDGCDRGKEKGNLIETKAKQFDLFPWYDSCKHTVYTWKFMNVNIHLHDDMISIYTSTHSDACWLSTWCIQVHNNNSNIYHQNDNNNLTWNNLNTHIAYSSCYLIKDFTFLNVLGSFCLLACVCPSFPNVLLHPFLPWRS